MTDSQNVNLILSLIPRNATNLLREAVAKVPDDPVGAVLDVGPIIANALSHGALSVTPTETAKLQIDPQKTRLCKFLKGNLPDILCSTDGRRHDYGLYRNDVDAAATELLPVAFSKRFAIGKTPHYLGQYTFLRIQKVNDRNTSDVFIPRLTYQLMPQNISQNLAQDDVFHVPVTTETNCVVPKTKVDFPLFFRSRSVATPHKFYFSPSQKKAQAVYSVRETFELHHPKSPGKPGDNRLGFSKKCVFLDDDTVLKNLLLFAKTTPIPS